MAIVFKRNYSASTAYSIDNIVRYTDGKTYISLADSNTGHTPGASGNESYWKELAGVKYNSDNPDWEENDTTKSSYIQNKPFTYNGTIVYNDNASAFENFCFLHDLDGHTIIIDGVAYAGEVDHVRDEYVHYINISDEENNKYYCLYWSGRDLHFKDSAYNDDDSNTFDKILPGDTNIIVADNRPAQPLFGSGLSYYHIGYLSNYYSSTGTANEQVSGDITLKLGDTEYSGDNIVYNYDTANDICYITLTKNNLNVIHIADINSSYTCDISYYDDTGALDHTDSAQNPSSYPLHIYLNREIYNINPLYNTFFDSLGSGGSGINVDYETTDTQVIVTMTSGSNTATISFDLADIKEY